MKMPQFAPLNRVPLRKFDRASAFPVATRLELVDRSCRSDAESPLQQGCKELQVSGLNLRNKPRKKLTLLRAVKMESYPHSIVGRPYRFRHARKGDGFRINVD